MQNAFCFPKCTVELGKQNWSKCRIYLTRWLYREQVWMKYLFIFELLAQFTPKPILNCSSRKTFPKWYSFLNLLKQTQTQPHIFLFLSAVPLSTTNEAFKSICYCFIIVVQSSYKESMATCWENIGANVQTTENSPIPHRAVAYKKVKSIK